MTTGAGLPGDVDPLLVALGVDPVPVIAALRVRGETIATAESLTGGLVCGALTCVPGSSEVVRGGLVVYATELKHELAGVDPVLLEEHGAVHPDVAAQLALGARLRCRATWGLGLTGVAGPDPQDGVEPGTVHVALSGDAADSMRTITAKGDRYAVRAAAVSAALDLLTTQLAELQR
jgi:nicotinamide-nucleotide amidase